MHLNIQAALKKQGITIREGDVILFNKGWSSSCSLSVAYII
jgi:uncharacterized cupin superfamily protein